MIEDLNGPELLGYGELTTASTRGPHVAGPVGRVGCGRPLLYPIPTADLPLPLRIRAEPAGERYLGALFAFDLEPLDRGDRYVAAEFEVKLDDQDCFAARVDIDGDALGITYESEPMSATATHTVRAAAQRPGWLRRLTGRERAPRAYPRGVQSSRFGWIYEDPRGTLLLPRNYGMHAILAVPDDATEITGTVGAKVSVAGHAESGWTRLDFTVPLPPAGPAPAGGPAVHLCMAADVVGYSRRINAVTKRIQQELVTLLAQARRAAGIPDGAVRPQPQGDGQFTVLPGGIDESAVIPALLGEFDRGLRELNAAADDRLRMRVALHRGLLEEGANGWIGTSSIAVHRILNSDQLRAVLTEHPTSDYVLGVPDVLYRDVFVHAMQPPLPEQFTEAEVSVPEKGFVERAWLYAG
jgi:hypothetical protein